MTIRLSQADVAPVLTCIRADGSTTWSKSAHGPFFASHDLMHYAVETTLGLRQAFFGLIAAGWSITDFAEPGAAARLPPAALYAEHIVNLLLQEQAFGTAAAAEEFNRTLAGALANAKPGKQPQQPPALTEEILCRIRGQFAEVSRQYRSMAADERLELRFL